MIGRHIESDPAGASQRYENPRDAYDDSIRHVCALAAPSQSARVTDHPSALMTGPVMGLSDELCKRS
jgi:hypothetical protein